VIAIGRKGFTLKLFWTCLHQHIVAELCHSLWDFKKRDSVVWFASMQGRQHFLMTKSTSLMNVLPPNPTEKDVIEQKRLLLQLGGEQKLEHLQLLESSLKKERRERAMMLSSIQVLSGLDQLHR
jgi:hypothetical protein